MAAGRPENSRPASDERDADRRWSRGGLYWGRLADDVLLGLPLGQQHNYHKRLRTNETS